MTAPSDTSSVTSDAVDADEAFAEMSRQYGLLAGQVIRQQMLLDKRGSRIIELEAAVRDAQSATAAPTAAD